MSNVWTKPWITIGFMFLGIVVSGCASAQKTAFRKERVLASVSDKENPYWAQYTEYFRNYVFEGKVTAGINGSVGKRCSVLLVHDPWINFRSDGSTETLDPGEMLIMNIWYVSDNPMTTASFTKHFMRRSEPETYHQAGKTGVMLREEPSASYNGVSYKDLIKSGYGSGGIIPKELQSELGTDWESRAALYRDELKIDYDDSGVPAQVEMSYHYGSKHFLAQRKHVNDLTLRCTR